MDKIICVVGPTASGKTALAIELAKEYNGEVISWAVGLAVPMSMPR